MPMRIVLLVSILALTACSTAGPFVTNISSSGDNTLTIEKCMIQFSAFTSTISNKNCTNVTIKLAR